MKVGSGQVGMTRLEVEKLKSEGMMVDEHTSYYMNGITATFGGLDVGFHNWLNNMDVFIGDEKVLISSKSHAKKVLKLMGIMVKADKLMEEIKSEKYNGGK